MSIKRLISMVNAIIQNGIRFYSKSSINLFGMSYNYILFYLVFALLASCKMNTNPSIKFVIPEALLFSKSTYSVGGNVTLLGTGKSLTIQLNSAGSQTISANGAYSIGGLANNATFDLDVLTQPTNQSCVIANATGTIAGANITNADITCSIGTLSSGTILNPLTLTGGVTTLNGSPCADNTSGCSSVSGFVDSTTPSSVKYNAAEGLTTDGTNLYVADKNNNRIRKVVIATGATTTLAGNGTNAKVDGKGTSASLSRPRFITTDGTYIYLSDTTNNCMRKINLNTQVVTTIVCNNSILSDPRGIVVYNNNLYIVDNSNNSIVQLNLSTNALTTVIASGLSSPRNLTIIGTDLYIADSGLDRIAKTTIGTWTLSTFAGSSSGYSDNIVGTSAQFRNLEGITTDGTSLYVADTGNHNIRKVTVPDSVVTTLAGQTISSGSNANYTNSTTFSSARFDNPRGITSDGLNLYVFDTVNNAIRKIQ
jgi:sugar lactone lactonase YvrE